MFINENGIMVLHEPENLIPNEGQNININYISDNLEKIMQHKQIYKWVNKEHAVNFHEKCLKEHPLNDFKLGKPDVYATHIEKQNESANNFAITLSFSGKILFNELEKLENFKEMLKSYFIKEIEEKSIGIESYLYYQNKDLKITNLGKCSKCEKKISESAPSYICYKCCQASKPKQFCIECITEESAYVKFENVDKIKEEVNQYNIYLNNLTTDDSPC